MDCERAYGTAFDAISAQGVHEPGPAEAGPARDRLGKAAGRCRRSRGRPEPPDESLLGEGPQVVEAPVREQAAELSALRGFQKEIAWGSQIRTYVFHPFTLVKDHRTGVESGQVDAVMDGALDPFIEAFLRWQLKQLNENVNSLERKTANE